MGECGWVLVGFFVLEIFLIAFFFFPGGHQHKALK